MSNKIIDFNSRGKNKPAFDNAFAAAKKAGADTPLDINEFISGGREDSVFTGEIGNSYNDDYGLKSGDIFFVNVTVKPAVSSLVLHKQKGEYKIHRLSELKSKKPEIVGVVTHILRTLIEREMAR